MIETVLFDLDNTLLDFDRAEHEALRQTLLHLCGYAPEEMLRRYNAINRAQWKLLEQGKASKRAVECQLKVPTHIWVRIPRHSNPTHLTKHYQTGLKSIKTQ